MCVAEWRRGQHGVRSRLESPPVQWAKLKSLDASGVGGGILLPYADWARSSSALPRLTGVRMAIVIQPSR